MSLVRKGNGKGAGLEIVARSDTGSMLQTRAVAKNSIDPVVTELEAVQIALVVA